MQTASFSSSQDLNSNQARTFEANQPVFSALMIAAGIMIFAAVSALGYVAVYEGTLPYADAVALGFIVAGVAGAVAVTVQALRETKPLRDFLKQEAESLKG